MQNLKKSLPDPLQKSVSVHGRIVQFIVLCLIFTGLITFYGHYYGLNTNFFDPNRNALINLSGLFITILISALITDYLTRIVKASRNK